MPSKRRNTKQIYTARTPWRGDRAPSATEADLSAMESYIQNNIDPKFKQSMHNQKDFLSGLDTTSGLLKYIKSSHCRRHSYMFVSSKCGHENCELCGKVKMDPELWSHVSDVHNPPLPMLDEDNKGHFLRYASAKESLQVSATFLQ